MYTYLDMIFHENPFFSFKLSLFDIYLLTKLSVTGLLDNDFQNSLESKNTNENQL